MCREHYSMKLEKAGMRGLQGTIARDYFGWWGGTQFNRNREAAGTICHIAVDYER